MKNNQLNTFLITIALASVILYVARPKNSLFKINIGKKRNKDKLPEKVSPPQEATSDESQNHKNGMIIIDAMRNAINDKIPQSEIDKLNKSFASEYKMKVFFGKNQKLVAKNSSGKMIAEE